MVYDILEKYRDEVTPTKEKGGCREGPDPRDAQSRLATPYREYRAEIGGVSFDIGMKSFSRVLQREN